MPTSTLTSRGQTTIPKSIREALQLQPGDRVEFLLDDDRVILRRAGADLTDLDGLLDRSGQDPVSIEDMETAVQQGASASASRSSADGGSE